MKISIIIPAYNEEKYIPKLLGDIKRQTFKDYEVIVADANSKDKTRIIAKRFGAKVVKGGKPAFGRNAGARVAQGDFLFFFDADVRFNKDFLERAYKEIQDKYLDLATCEFIPLSNLVIDKELHRITNAFIKVNQYTNPHAGGFCILVSKRLYNRVKGFNEKLFLAEDHDFVKRASKFRHLRVLEKVKIKISVRRLQKEGRLNLSRKYLYSGLYRSLYGEIDKDIINYEFGQFSKKNKHFWERNLLKMDRRLQGLARHYNIIVQKLNKNIF